MKRINVKSSQIKSIGYDVGARVMEVEFITGSIYEYADVPQETYDGALSAESIGKYFGANIKQSFAYKKIGEPIPKPAPAETPMTITADDEPVTALKRVGSSASVMKQAANILVVKDDETAATGGAMLKQLKDFAKEIDRTRKGFTDPLNATIKKITAPFAAKIEEVNAAAAIVSGKVLAYQSAQRKIKEEQEKARINENVESTVELAGMMIDDKDRDAMLNAAVDASNEKVNVVQNVRGDGVTTSLRLTWTYEVITESDIPRQFMMPNPDAIKYAITKMDTREIPGLKIYQKESLAVR